MKTFKKNLFLFPAFCLAMFLLFQWSCKKEDPVVPPEISTIAITEITTTSAKSGGNVISDGGGAITARGLVWRTSTGPTLEQHTGMKNEGTGTGIFSSDIMGLSPNVQYFVRAFATNSTGTVYGNELQFTTSGVTATVTTADITNVTQTTATGGGNVTIDGNPSVSACGIVWNTVSGPTIETKLGMTNDGAGSGSFTSNLTALAPKTTYYVRAYATNNVGTSYGEEKSFVTPNNDGNPCIGMPSVTDARDNNTYNTVQIGERCWLKENLKYLPEVYAANGSGSTTNPHYYVYDYNGTSVAAAKSTDNYQHYGVLYNHAAAINACPAGWRLPDISEWRQLRDYLIEEYDLEAENIYNNDVGNRLKSRRQVDSPLGGEFATSAHPRWDYHDTQYGTDDFGFSALPAGAKGHLSSVLIGSRLFWWSSTPAYTNGVHVIQLYLDSPTFWEDELGVSNGFSIRCIKD
jgi:uncharacterized protein (TIGR02145 family)